MKKSLAVPNLFVLLVFCSIVSLTSKTFSRFVQFFCSRFVQFFVRGFQLFHSRLYSYLPRFFLKEYHDILTIFLSPIFFLCKVILSLLMVIFSKKLKCAVICAGYAAQILDSLWQLPIRYLMSWFMACIYSISVLYISKTSFILFMVFSCATHAHSKVEVHNILPH